MKLENGVFTEIIYEIGGSMHFMPNYRDASIIINLDAMS